MEDRRFRELFGSPMEIVLHVWYMMEEDGLLSDKIKPKHLLWTLYFLKVYTSTRGPRMFRCWRRGGCRRPTNTAKMGVALHRAHRQAGGQCGELFLCGLMSRLASTHPPLCPPPPSTRSSLRAVSSKTLATTASCRLAGRTFKSRRRIPQQGGMPLHPINTRGSPRTGTSLGSTSSRGIWCGSADPTLPVSGTTSNFFEQARPLSQARQEG
jgi:hypothetical protein